MARPTTKQELVAAANERFSALVSQIETMPPAALAAPFDFSLDAKAKEAHWHRDKNLRDVLTHLYEWHRLLLDWVNANLSGEAKPFLPPPYNWKTYGQMNEGFYEKHQGTSYEDARKLLMQSHADVMALIESLPEAGMFEKKAYPFTGTSTLGSYCVSATASHYDWALTKLKKHIKATHA